MSAACDALTSERASQIAADACARDRVVRAARAELAEVVGFLGIDEVRVLTRIGQRLALGAMRYGALEVASDQRDFAGREAREEVEDSLVYFACAWLKREAAETAKGGGE